MPDIAEFLPLMQAALRIDTLPSDEQIAHAGNSIPNSERHRIADYCRHQIQHRWKIHRLRLLAMNDDGSGVVALRFAR